MAAAPVATQFLSLPELKQNPLIMRIFATLDADGGGDVDFGEFVQVRRRTRRAPSPTHAPTDRAASCGQCLRIFSTRGDRQAKLMCTRRRAAQPQCAAR